MIFMLIDKFRGFLGQLIEFDDFASINYFSVSISSTNLVYFGFIFFYELNLFIETQKLLPSLSSEFIAINFELASGFIKLILQLRKIISLFLVGTLLTLDKSHLSYIFH